MTEDIHDLMNRMRCGEMKEFTPGTLLEAATAIHSVRMVLLTDVEDDGADPVAEEHYLAALAHLELAYRAMRLAQYAQSRALAVIQTGGKGGRT